MAKSKVLKAVTSEEASKKALKMIELEKAGYQLGLYSSNYKLNKAMRKYFRFGNVTLIAGLSGSGKSYFLTNLYKDFYNLELNKVYKDKIKILHFGLEMSPENEMIRSISSDVDMTYNYMLSSNFEKNSDIHNVITEQELLHISDALQSRKKSPVLYFPEPGSIDDIHKTFVYYNNLYPNHKLVVGIDHTLLIKKVNESDDKELMGRIAKAAISMKEKDANVLLLAQLNNRIEELDRIKNKSMHFPKKSDIYAQAQIYNACDDVFVIHKPKSLNITEYSNKNLSTDDLIHLCKLKGRFGTTGSIWLKDNLHKGVIASK